MSYLLDTNICIALINGSSEKARSRTAEALHRDDALMTSSISVHELWYGVAKSRQRERNTNTLTAFLNSAIETLDFDEQDARAAAGIRAELERRGERIGEYDTLIAGQALARKLILVTANTREFNRVAELTVEDWTQ